MPSYTYPLSAPRRKPQLLLSLSALLLLTLLTGCQEDARATKTNTARASELADGRLSKATGGLLETFGQQEPAADNSNASTNDSRVPDAPRELTWNAPLTREDGSALALGQIAGFRIYYRLRYQEDYEVISIEDPTASHYSLENLPPGAYEFSITTIDESGLESRRSEPVTANLI
jgi:hypothetical protein